MDMDPDNERSRWNVDHDENAEIAAEIIDDEDDAPATDEFASDLMDAAWYRAMAAAASRAACGGRDRRVVLRDLQEQGPRWLFQWIHRDSVGAALAMIRCAESREMYAIGRRALRDTPVLRPPVTT